MAMLGDALQISTYAGRVASRATDGFLSLMPKLGACSHTLPAKITWWSVDLRFNTKVAALGIYNRADCCRKLLHTFRCQTISSSKMTIPFHIFSMIFFTALS